MSKYTITIKNLIDNNFDFKLDSYPIFDENYRETLNNNILYHYYMNEIGLETPALFRFYLIQKLNEIMPYYNILYVKQNVLLNDIINNVSLSENLEKENTNNSSSSSNSNSSSSGTSNNKNLFLDTPQGNEYKGTIDETNFATNVNFDKNTNSNSIVDTSSNTDTSTGAENYVKNLIGRNGGKYNLDILQDLKNNLLNIDLLIIKDLNELFMGIF